LAAVLGGCAATDRQPSALGVTPAPSLSAGPGSSCPTWREPRQCRPPAAVATPGPDENLLRNEGIRTMPAPPDAVPRISREQAIATAESALRMTGHLRKPGNPEADLRLITTRYTMTDGHKYHGRLVWVVTDHDTAGHRFYGRDPTPPPRCESTVIVDADSGANLDGVETVCPGPLGDPAN
jgi:hypothetical protein